MKLGIKQSILGLTLVASNGLAAESPNPRQLHISSFLYEGSGCPEGSAASSISTDGQAITVLFDDYLVEVEPNQSQAKKTCKMRLGIDVPSGWTFGLFGVSYYGYASLDEGVKGVQDSMFRFGRRQGEKEVGRMVLKGIYDDDYENHTEVDLETINWAPCRQRTKNLILKTSLKLKNHRRQANGLMTLDSVDGEIKHQYNVAWKKCNPNDSSTPSTPRQSNSFCNEETIHWDKRGIIKNPRPPRGRDRVRHRVSRRGGSSRGHPQRSVCSAVVGQMSWGTKQTIKNSAPGKEGKIKLVCKRGKWKIANPRATRPICQRG